MQQFTDWFTTPVYLVIFVVNVIVHLVNTIEMIWIILLRNINFFYGPVLKDKSSHIITVSFLNLVRFLNQPRCQSNATTEDIFLQMAEFEPIYNDLYMNLFFSRGLAV